MEKKLERVIARARGNGYLKLHSFLNLLLQAENSGFFSRGTRHDLIVEGNSVKFGEPLEKTFNLEKRMLFRAKLEEILQGTGNNREQINCIYSSALLCLLVFYRVDKTNPLQMDVNGRKTVFTDSHFEIKLPVFNPQAPANMDVVLDGTYEDTGKPVRLYLESKFLEYIQGVCDQKGISKQYEDWYKKVEQGIQAENSPKWDVRFVFDADSISLKTLREIPTEFTNIRPTVKHYCEGIKQIVSHFIGVYKSLETPTDADVYLGTILFDFTSRPETASAETQKLFEDYAIHYETLARSLNGLTDGRFTMLPTVQTYQKVLEEATGYKVDTEVKQYYGF